MYNQALTIVQWVVIAFMVIVGSIFIFHLIPDSMRFVDRGKKVADDMHCEYLTSIKSTDVRVLDCNGEIKMVRVK